MKIHKVEQKSPEWLEIRKGKMTASHATEIGNNGTGLETYIKEIVYKELSSSKEENYINEDMKRGNELEPVARELYELETGNKVEEVGFIEYDKFIGCSPDGLIGDDGGLEIKCPNDKNFFEYLLNGEKAISSYYQWQCQMNLLITGRKWWDLVLFNPNFEQSMFIFKILPDKTKFEALEKGLAVGKEQIKLIKNKLK